MHEGFPGDTGWGSSRPRCGETERSPWATDGDPRFLSSHCFSLVPGTMQGGRAGAWSQGSKDKWLDLCLRSITHTEPVVGAVRREGLLWEHGEENTAGLLAQALSGGCWPAPRLVRGSARPACAGPQGETSLAWFPKARRSQGQHAVTSWDLGIVVLGPQRGCRPFPQPPFLPGQSVVCSDCSVPPRDRHGAPLWSPERTAVSREQSFSIGSKWPVTDPRSTFTPMDRKTLSPVSLPIKLMLIWIQLRGRHPDWPLDGAMMVKRAVSALKEFLV